MDFGDESKAFGCENKVPIMGQKASSSSQVNDCSYGVKEKLSYSLVNSVALSRELKM